VDGIRTSDLLIASLMPASLNYS